MHTFFIYRKHNSQGDVGNSTIVRYSAAEIADSGTGKITLAPADRIDSQNITTTSFDLRGNPVEQEMVKYVYDVKTAGFIFSQAQRIKNDKYSLHDRVANSVVRNYADAAFTTFVDAQVISYEYNNSGDVTKQIVKKYSDEAAKK